VHIAEALKHYLVELTEGTRRHGAVELGLSPRATLQLAAASRAHAAARGQNYVSPDDVKAVAVSVLSHRLILRAEQGDRFSQEDVIGELVDSVPIPVRR
jgi:MoxR-like ATPase